MKKLFPLLFLLASITSMAQTDNYSGFNYQAVVRDAQGQPVPNQAVGVQFILGCGIAAPYLETHSTTSDAQGLIALVIGEGTPGGAIPSFDAIDWNGCGVASWGLTVAMDITGGTNYVQVGVQELKAVPFALNVLNGSGDGWVVNGDTLYNNGKHVGIGTTNPDTTLHVLGKLKYQDGSQGAAKVLTSDAAGNASWQNLTAESILGSGNVPGGDLSCLRNAATIATGSEPISIAVSGNYAYVVNHVSNNMMVFDISNPNAPSLSATIATGTNPISVAISGNYAYVVNHSSNNMMVFSISDPGAPILSATIATGSLPRSVAVSGNYAYVVNQGSNTMMVFDIAAPVNGDLPIATIATGSLPFSVAVSGNYACVVHVGSDNMMVFDISNPNAPSLSATIATGTNPISVAISGNYGYVVNQSSNNMMVFNISNPGAPILSATIAAGSQPFSVAVSGNYAYVVHIGSDNMMVFDISNPNAPSLSATIATGSFPGSVAISGNHAYVTNTNSNNMMVFELFCPQAIGIDASGQFVIQDPTWASAGADIVNANTGNVGIGWASPTSRFAVQTGTDTQGSRLLFDDLGISIVDRFFGNDFAAKIWGEWPGDGRLHFGVNSNGGAASVVPTMTIRNVGGTGTVGNVGIGTTAPTATLSVNGTANKPGGGSWAVFSDRRLKKDIRLYADGLNSVLAINPVKFKYNGISVADTTTEYIGVIAQELEEVSPYMINTIDIEGTEYLEVDNSAMTYMLINAVKELNAMIEEQQERIAELEATIGKQDLDNTVLRSELAQQRKLIEANANLLKDLTSALNAQSSK